jgi:Ran GTPase-activating protein (RanGAP) involved in mRNA processing and transport
VDDLVDDLLALSWCFRDVSSFRRKTHKDHSFENDDLFYWTWTDVYLAVPETQLKVVSALKLIPQHGCWKDLVHLAVTAHNSGNDINRCQVEQFIDGIVDIFVQQLRRDVDVYKTYCASKENSQQPSCLRDAERKGAQALNAQLPSDCAIYAPRFESAADRACRLAKRVAYGLAPYFPRIRVSSENERAKETIYVNYKKVLRDIRRVLRNDKLSYTEQQPRMCHIRSHSGAMCTLQNAPYNTTSIKEFLGTSLPENVVNPHEEPVSSCQLDELDPILDWLLSNAPLNMPDYYFRRGYVTIGGTLDMCKQVVGPQGIRPLMEGIKSNEHITKFLLGNNVTEIKGAKAIAAEMRRKGTHIDTWYLAGNQWDAHAIADIADALRDNTLIKSLWLKRNPLRPPGARHLAEMLRFNTHLQVLDLATCGLLDEGVEYLMDCLGNHNDTLLHLMLDGNGITPVGAARIGQYLASGKNRLITLSIEANKITDVGIPAIAEGLRADKTIERLRIGSNMIGPEGARLLFDSIADHPALIYLSLGHPKMTRMLDMKANFLGDEGAKHAAEYLKRSARIRVLDLARSGITTVGIQSILAALADADEACLGNRSLVWLGLSYGGHHCKATITALSQCLERNLELAREKVGDEHFNPSDILMPEYVREVMSVYRTKDM